MKILFVMLVLVTGVHGAFAEVPTLKGKKVRIIMPENPSVSFEGLSLEGELKQPAEFYFQNRNQERFDSLTKRRTNFRREMLRDAVQSN